MVAKVVKREGQTRAICLQQTKNVRLRSLAIRAVFREVRLSRRDKLQQSDSAETLPIETVGGDDVESSRAHSNAP